jgi:hypothetical protein
MWFLGVFLVKIGQFFKKNGGFFRFFVELWMTKISLPVNKI